VERKVWVTSLLINSNPQHIRNWINNLVADNQPTFAISTDNGILNQVAEERMTFAKVSRGHEAHRDVQQSTRWTWKGLEDCQLKSFGLEVVLERLGSLEIDNENSGLKSQLVVPFDFLHFVGDKDICGSFVSASHE
jgi:hypothetical protein